MQFQESKIANKYLSGLKGIEIGASQHNPFNLDTVFVDHPDKWKTYHQEQIRLDGDYLRPTLFADACDLPFLNKSYDFVINSHVIEHIWRPQDALKEWIRVAKKYIFLIVPHKDRTFDKDREITTAEEILAREPKKTYEDKHHSVWRTQDFIDFIKKSELPLEIVEVLDVDDKVGNGFCIILKIKDESTK